MKTQMNADIISMKHIKVLTATLQIIDEVLDNTTTIDRREDSECCDARPIKEALDEIRPLLAKSINDVDGEVEKAWKRVKP